MQAIIASTSTIHGSSYLEYLLPTLETHFADVEDILFIPFARSGGITHDDYTEKAKKGLKPCGKNVRGLHEFKDPKKAIASAEAIFVGGGNTFLLVKQLHELGLMDVLRTAIDAGAPYLGTSAGSNIFGLTMQTTNDMPIVYPPSFKTLGLLDFNINAHYKDPDLKSTHKGETRETRIKEFQNLNSVIVVGLREGSWLKVSDSKITLENNFSARIFEPGQLAYEIDPNAILNFN
ncbi:alpha-aspartyl dipeptidase PepE [Psychroflexus torquis ATCC 700755]|uniref:Alpha-aspartyl dipeptidase PepE n=1 Tax=Psychroflexus torquis (strain ATCC 700755 / CIP 106069 / ACAM 623) TaxID=313595 RepID=K4IAH3_PSYTT|nr:dipeptidase PepE [Psychroflexus torquis]AFU67612.1 alpha-aspartyl dipeptidase PepE [Psychroflexus torquis ATCC 700755]